MNDYIYIVFQQIHNCLIPFVTVTLFVSVCMPGMFAHYYACQLLYLIDGLLVIWYDSYQFNFLCWRYDIISFTGLATFCFLCFGNFELFYIHFVNNYSFVSNKTWVLDIIVFWFSESESSVDINIHILHKMLFRVVRILLCICMYTLSWISLLPFITMQHSIHALLYIISSPNFGSYLC